MENLLLHRCELTSGKSRSESTFAILRCCCHEFQKKKETFIGFAEHSYIYGVKQTVHKAAESALCELILSLEKGFVKKNKPQFPVYNNNNLI